MNTSIVKRSFFILLAATMVLGMCCISYADTSKGLSSSEFTEWEVRFSNWFWEGQDAGGIIIYREDENEDIFERVEPLSVESSDPDVLRVGPYVANGKEHICLFPRKPGSSYVTVRYDSGNGIAEFSKTVVVKPYPDQFISLKVNGKKVKVSDHKYKFKKKYKGTKAKVKVALKDGWKIKDSDGAFYKKKYSGLKEIEVSEKTLIKGKAISFPKKYKLLYVFLTLYNENTEEEIDYTIEFYR